jgi:FkbO/Hyg5 family chorismatase
MRDDSTHVRSCLTFDDAELREVLLSKNVLGMMEFHRGSPAFAIPPAIPHVRVHMDPCDSDAVAEAWVTTGSVEYGARGRFRVASDGQVLFGCTSCPEGRQDLTEMARQIYDELFASIAALDYPHLFRVWNFFPRINHEDASLERYQAFCLGRALSFEANNSVEEQRRFPAATGIGSMGGDICVVFLASREAACRHIENPRQVPAYRYPRQYGPQPPSFARATYLHRREGGAIYVSGTAAVVGHRSVHRGDAEQQCRATCENLEVLLAAENLQRHGVAASASPRDLSTIKVYVRRPEDLPVVKRVCDEAFGPIRRVAYLRADVCRAELLIEIEGVVARGGPSRVGGTTAPYEL